MLAPDDLSPIAPAPALSEQDLRFCAEYVERRCPVSAAIAAYPGLGPSAVREAAHAALARPEVMERINMLFSVEHMQEAEAMAHLASIARGAKRDQDRLRALEDVLKLMGKFDNDSGASALLVALREAGSVADAFVVVQREHYGVE